MQNENVTPNLLAALTTMDERTENGLTRLILHLRHHYNSGTAQRESATAHKSGDYSNSLSPGSLPNGLVALTFVAAHKTALQVILPEILRLCQEYEFKESHYDWASSGDEALGVSINIKSHWGQFY